MSVTTQITVDVLNPGAPEVVHAKQYDTGRIVEIVLTEGGVPFAPQAGTIATLKAGKPDGTGTFYDVTLEGNVVTCELVQQVLAVPGPVRAEVSLVYEDERITTFCFAIFVQKTALDDAEIESSDYFTALTELVQEISEAQGRTATFTPSVSAQGVISWTNDGERENPEPRNIMGPQGPQGPQGDPGIGFEIRGIYATLAALRSAVQNPQQGWMYNVGTSAPYTIYMWDATTNPAAWVSLGQLQGPAGETGPQGPAGVNGAAAQINGYNAITLAAGDGLALTRSGTTFTLALDLDDYEGGAF